MSTPSPCLDESTFMDLLMGTLPPERAARVDEHLDSCVSCRRMVADALRVQSSSAAEPPALERTQTPTVALSVASARTPSRGADLPLERGSAVGRYLVLERLGAGGMGVVYSAYDPELDRRVALKLLREKALGLDAEKARAHLLHEAQAMARVSHPNVIAVYDVGTFGTQVFMAMELVEAQTLRQWLKAGPRPWRQVRDLFVDAGKGLAAAHAAGIIHGDFKPENILVGKEGRVRVTDFGLSRTASVPDAEEDGKPRVSGGTPAYMAPEQFIHEGHADARSDQFSLCAALYEGLYGERAFAGHTLKELSAEVTAGRVRHAPKGTAVPPWLRRVVLRGLSTRPEERHPSLEALLAALQADPAVRWKRRAQLGGGLLLLLGAVGVTHALHARAERACEGAERELTGVWDAERKRAVEASFRATGKPFAAAAWTSVQRALDGYSAAWVTTRTAACEATRVRGEQPETVMAQRMRCLDQRLAEVSALTHLFARADGELVERAPRAAEGLTPLASCSDAAALAALGPDPADPTARARAEALRQMLVQSRALLASGRYTQGVAMAEPAARQAKEHQDRHGGADALLLLAELKDLAGDYRGAERAVFEALWNAEAGRNDEAAARAWTLAVRIVGERLEQYPLGHRWRERAEAAIERLGGNEVLRASLAANVGRMLTGQGRYPEAAEQFELAIARLEKAFGPESLEAANVRIELGSVRLFQDRPEEALALHEAVLAQLRRALGPDHPEVARVLIEQAQARWQQQDYAESERVARTALELLERSVGPEHPQVGFALNMLASAIQFQGRAEEALPLQERALRVMEGAEGAESSNVAIFMNNLAGILNHLGRLPEATRVYTEAIARMERRLGPEHPTLAPLLRSMGQTLFRQRKPQEALPYFQRAVRIHEAQQDDVHGGWTGSLLNLGQTYLALGQNHEALAALEKALAGWERAKPSAGERSALRFILGQALWTANTDRPRAMRLVNEAREQMRTLPDDPTHRVLLPALEAWLAKLPPKERRAAEQAPAPVTTPAPP
jgi:tetratricopeptide (TPR) repeat protein